MRLSESQLPRPANVMSSTSELQCTTSFVDSPRSDPTQDIANLTPPIRYGPTPRACPAPSRHST